MEKIKVCMAVMAMLLAVGCVSQDNGKQVLYELTLDKWSNTGDSSLDIIQLDGRQVLRFDRGGRVGNMGEASIYYEDDTIHESVNSITFKAKGISILDEEEYYNETFIVFASDGVEQITKKFTMIVSGYGREPTKIGWEELTFSLPADFKIVRFGFIIPQEPIGELTTLLLRELKLNSR